MHKVRWAIYGTGEVAELFAQGLSHVEGAVLHSVCSRTRGRADEFSRRFGAQHAHMSYVDLLEDSAVDIVYVATRNQFHHEDTLAAIRAGKAVLCEKPFALNVDQGRDIVQASRDRGVFCMEAMWMRCSPAVREARDIARGGAIGDIKLVSAQLGFPIRFDPLDRVFASPGGGALFDYGVYPLSFAHAILGRPDRIRSAACIGPTGVDDQFAAILEYDSGSQAMIAASLRTQLANAAEIHGADGVLDRIGPLYFPKGYRLERTPANIRGQPNASPKRLVTLPLRAWSRFKRVALGRDGVGRTFTREVVNGYATEANIVQQCLRAGLLESAEMPLNETIEVLESMDAIRSRWTSHA